MKKVYVILNFYYERKDKLVLVAVNRGGALP